MNQKRINWEKTISFLSDVGFGLCLGIIVDQIAGTSFIFTLVGLALGIGLAFALKNVRKKKEEKKQ